MFPKHAIGLDLVFDLYMTLVTFENNVHKPISELLIKSRFNIIDYKYGWIHFKVNVNYCSRTYVSLGYNI